MVRDYIGNSSLTLAGPCRPQDDAGKAPRQYEVVGVKPRRRAVAGGAVDGGVSSHPHRPSGSHTACPAWRHRHWPAVCFLPNLSTGLPARRRTDARRCCRRVNSRAANVLSGPGLAGLLVSCSAVPVSSAALHAVSRPVECVLGPGWQDSKASWCCEHASAERRTRRRIQGAGCSRGAPFRSF